MAALHLVTFTSRVALYAEIQFGLWGEVVKDYQQAFDGLESSLVEGRGELAHLHLILLPPIPLVSSLVTSVLPWLGVFLKLGESL